MSLDKFRVSMALTVDAYLTFKACVRALSLLLLGHGDIPSDRLYKVSEPQLVLYCVSTVMVMIRKCG